MWSAVLYGRDTFFLSLFLTQYEEIKTGMTDAGHDMVTPPFLVQERCFQLMAFFSLNLSIAEGYFSTQYLSWIGVPCELMPFPAQVKGRMNKLAS